MPHHTTHQPHQTTPKPHQSHTAPRHTMGADCLYPQIAFLVRHKQHNTTSYHTTPRHATRHLLTPHRNRPRHAAPHRTTPNHTTPHPATQHRTTPHRITPRHTTPHHATQRSAAQRNTTTTPRHTTPHHTPLRPTTPHHTTHHHTTPHHTTPTPTPHPLPHHTRLTHPNPTSQMLVASGRSKLTADESLSNDSLAAQFAPSYVYPPRGPHPAVLPPIPEMPVAVLLPLLPGSSAGKMQKVRSLACSPFRIFHPYRCTHPIPIPIHPIPIGYPFGISHPASLSRAMPLAPSPTAHRVWNRPSLWYPGAMAVVSWGHG